MNFTIFSHAMFSCIGSHRRLLRFLGVTEPLLELEFERRLLEFERRLVEKVKQFLLELGQGFTYIGNQHVLSYNGKDYKVDMLFFSSGASVARHRRFGNLRVHARIYQQDEPL